VEEIDQQSSWTRQDFGHNRATTSGQNDCVDSVASGPVERPVLRHSRERTHGQGVTYWRRRGGRLMQQGMWLAVICMLHGMYTPSFASISCLHARPLPRSISLFLTLHSIRFRCLAWLLLLVLVPVLLPVTLLPDVGASCNVAGFALAGPVEETEISPLYHSAECPAGQAACVLPVNVNISLQYKGAGALTDAIVSIDVYPKNVTINGVTSTGLALSLFIKNV